MKAIKRKGERSFENKKGMKRWKDGGEGEEKRM